MTEEERLRHNKYMREWRARQSKEKLAQMYEQVKQWAKANPDKIKEHKLRWAEANREYNRKQQRQNYAANREKESERKRRMKKTNPESYLRKREYDRQYQMNNPDWVRVQNHKRRVRLGYIKTRAHNVDDLQWIRIMQNNQCPYCQVKFDGTEHLDHLVPVSRGGKNDLFNIQFTCGPCNQRKFTQTDKEFRQCQ